MWSSVAAAGTKERMTVMLVVSKMSGLTGVKWLPWGVSLSANSALEWLNRLTGPLVATQAEPLQSIFEQLSLFSLKTWDS